MCHHTSFYQGSWNWIPLGDSVIFRLLPRVLIPQQLKPGMILVGKKRLQATEHRSCLLEIRPEGPEMMRTVSRCMDTDSICYGRALNMDPGDVLGQLWRWILGSISGSEWSEFSFLSDAPRQTEKSSSFFYPELHDRSEEDCQDFVLEKGTPAQDRGVLLAS